MESRFHTLEVSDIHRQTADAVAVSFQVPAELRDTFRFIPGQFLTLRTHIDGVDTRRSYSICSGLDDPDLRVAVKKVDGGAFSSFVNHGLSAGMQLDVMPPEGRFTANLSAEAENAYVGFASGSGVTPILSIIKSILAREPSGTFTLFYGNRAADSVIFREELEDLKDRYLKRFTLNHILSGEGQDIDLFHGRLDQEKVARFAKGGLFSVSDTDRFFICGPGDMIEQVRTALSDLAVSSEKISFERFVPDGAAAAPRTASKKAQKIAEAGVNIEVVADGSRRNFTMTGSDTNVIDAAHRTGLELPYSCKGGMCSTCRCKVVEGEAEMAQNYSLERWELEAGFILACQSRPLSRRLVLDFDEV
ncbi:MAG: 1,2-phenylacetyl-CoA epoxidase subunit PaaE [Stappiaceae bacterium]